MYFNEIFYTYLEETDLVFLLFDMSWIIKNFQDSGENAMKKLLFHNLFPDSKFHNSFHNNRRISIILLFERKT